MEKNSDITDSMPPLLSALLLWFVISTAAHADAIDNAIEEAMKTFSSAASLFELVSDCPQYSTMSEAKSCELADTLGLGLVCPPLTAKDTSQEAPRSCSIEFKDVVAGEIGLGAMARLKASDIDSYEFRMTYKPLSSLDTHLHDNSVTPGGTDPQQWIKRKDRVQMFAAIYDASEVSTTIPVPNPGVPLSNANNPIINFTAEVKNAQGAAVSWEGIVCGFVTHETGSRSCPVEQQSEQPQTPPTEQ